MRNDAMFICRDCHQKLPVSESVKDASRKRGIMERCKPCDRKRKLAHRQNPETGPEQRTRVQKASARARRERKEAGMSWSDSLTDEQLAHRRGQMRKYMRERRWVEIGASREYYDGKFAEQGGKCAICGVEKPSVVGNVEGSANEFFCIDHNHATKILRGLLCTPCNLVIGNAKDDADILRSAIAYLEHWEAVT